MANPCFDCGLRPRHVSSSGKVQSYCFECASRKSKERKEKYYLAQKDYDPAPKKQGRPRTPRPTPEDTPINRLRLELIEQAHKMSVLRLTAIRAVMNRDFTELEMLLSTHLHPQAEDIIV